MKITTIILTLCLSSVAALNSFGQGNKLFIDVHHLALGAVKFDDVAKAHLKDLATQKKYGVSFLRYWVDEAGGNVYCLSSASDSTAIIKTHAEAHGLLPAKTYMVTAGQEALLKPGNKFYLDIHQLGAGGVKASDVAVAHQKDLAVQDRYKVNFVNYWVDERSGTVVCLSQAPDSGAVINTHKDAHGLLPATIEQVKQGN